MVRTGTPVAAGKRVARSVVLLAVSFSTRADLKGREVDRAGRPFSSPSQSSLWRGEPHPLGTTSVQWVADGREWLGEPCRTTGSVCRWMLGLLDTHRASSPGKRRPEGGKQTVLLALGHRGGCPVPVPSRGSLELLAASSPDLLSRCLPLRRRSRRGTASPW